MKGSKKTPFQREVMGIVLTAANNGTLLGSAEIYDLWSQKPHKTYGSLRKVLEKLEKSGMIIRDRTEADGRKVKMVPTQRGYDWFSPL